MNEKSLKLYRFWSSTRWFINLGIKTFDFIGSKYDKLKAGDLNIAKTKMSALKSISKDNDVSSINRICDIFKKDNYIWRSDPLKGKFDYKSDPMITVANKTGDCDDFATLWCSLYPQFDRYSIFSDDVKSGHVIAIGKINDSYMVVSNIKQLGCYQVDSPEKALIEASKDWFTNGELYCFMKFNKKGTLEYIKVYPY